MLESSFSHSNREKGKGDRSCVSSLLSQRLQRNVFAFVTFSVFGERCSLSLVVVSHGAFRRRVDTERMNSRTRHRRTSLHMDTNTDYSHCLNSTGGSAHSAHAGQIASREHKKWWDPHRRPTVSQYICGKDISPSLVNGGVCASGYLD